MQILLIEPFQQLKDKILGNHRNVVKEIVGDLMEEERRRNLNY